MSDPSRPSKRFGFFAGLLVGAAATLAAIALYFELSGDRISEPTVRDQAEAFIEDSYFQKVTDDELESGSIRGMIDELRKEYDDKFSHYFDPKEYRQFQKALSGDFKGVGLSIKEVPEGLEVTTVFPDSPAEGAGIAVGDVILAADGKNLGGIPAEVATAKIKGKVGTEVDLTVKSVEGGTKEIPVERANITFPAAQGRIMHINGRKVGYIVYASFDQGAHAELRAEIERLRREGAEGLILDLRGNGGGRLDEAIASASLFVEEGDIVTTRGRATGEEVYDALGDALDPVPTVVLIDGGTASASEILAAAMSDYGLATLVGETTFGKGTVQESVPLPDGSAINLTVAEYFTSEDISIADEGIPPDVKAPADLKTDQDEALDKALEVLGQKLP
ncbi:MAG: carboxyl-terminal processing protease [Solirubrobacterales bacterium]|nr:carboxyl-terminal processing protease [Solirubrobacterales bacterium]